MSRHKNCPTFVKLRLAYGLLPWQFRKRKITFKTVIFSIKQVPALLTNYLITKCLICVVTKLKNYAGHVFGVF